MLTLANDRIKIKITFTPMSDDNSYHDAVESILRSTATDPIGIDFTNNEEGKIYLYGPDEVCEQVIDLIRYNGFNVLDSEVVASKPPKQYRRTAAMRTLRKAA